MQGGPRGRSPTEGSVGAESGEEQWGNRVYRGRKWKVTVNSPELGA